jgi:hypothetical protein
LVGIAPGALAEIIEVRGEAQIVLLSGGKRLLEQGQISRREISD